MVSESNTTSKKWHHYVTVPKPWDELLVLVISVLLTVPTFLIVHRNLPDFKWRLYTQEITTALLIIIFYLFVLLRFRKVVLICLLLYFLVLIYGTLLGGYGFRRVTNDYSSLLYSLNDSPYPQDVLLDRILPFPNKTEVLTAIDYQSPTVRDFAVMAARQYGRDIKGYESYYRIVQCFAVFKKINANWFYVSDPKGQEYFAPASESVRLLSGDCDDHAILMAAATRAIGGTPRIIHTDGHLYPELLIGDKHDLETINFLIKTKLFPIESKHKKVHYHIDERGQIWLNLDYTAHYPGGPFMEKPILGELYIQ